MEGTRVLLTVGHGAATDDELGALLSAAGVELVVDVRRFPGSRKHPHFAREALAGWLPQRGISYRWSEDLGGRRRLPSGRATVDTWWTVEQFAAYAAHTRSREFHSALDTLLDDAGRRSTAIMCSEAVWWRCHRRLIADVAVLQRGVDVRHLMPDGKLRPHPPAAGARLRDGELVWDGPR